MVFGRNERILVDEEFDVMGLLPTTTGEKVLSFVTDEKYLPEANNERIRCVICKPDMVEKLPTHISGVVLSDAPIISYFDIHNRYGKKQETYDTVIGEGCSISPLASVATQNVRIGNNVVIEEFVSIKEGVTIGDNTIIRAGCVVGGQGFEFKRMPEGGVLPVEHYGGVIIGNDVEIQQLTNVSRAVYAWDNTIIGDGTKIDALVHVAHAVKLGKRCFAAAGAMIAGSTVFGDDTWIGVNATISNCLKVEKSARVSLGSVVTKNVNEGETVTGNFAIPHKVFLDDLKQTLKKA